METPTGTTDLSFERDVKPLFRETDRDSMSDTFDLWSYEDVRDNADDILRVLEDGSMPCDGEWPQEQINTFRGWMAVGMPP